MALIEREDLIRRLSQIPGYMDAENDTLVSVSEIRNLVCQMPDVETVPIKPLSVWLAGYAVPPKYTVATNPMDSMKARAEGWERHIRNLIECGLMEDAL